ncbi:S53 family serine peptidase [Acidicapsa dinghuensis]|uniref:S53 family serine peptidase n=1 Tax=Acidicapsa dinghuensis TaxID=2218256 RepID=A0ABW1ENW7_9BACT|nr:S53 family serine peptidase [Acidicapsa dinghuensis]
MARFVALPASQCHLLPYSRLAGQIDHSTIASITVRVRSRGDLRELKELVETQGSQVPTRRKYLTRAAFASRYGARPDDLDAVERYASGHNLLIERRSAAERVLKLRGEMGDILRAFPAHVRLYHHAHGTYRGRSGEIQVPAHLSEIVTGIFGFDTRPLRRRGFRQRVSNGGPGGDNGVAASFFAQRYNFPVEYNGKKLDGAGQSIGIVELGGGYDVKDLQDYFSTVKAPVPNVVPVSAGADNSPGSSSDGEVMLDLEVAGTVAPAANLAVYFGTNTGQGFRNAVSAAVHDDQRQIDVISISWGSPEPRGGITQEVLDFNSIFLEAASLGITVCVATGDYGTADNEPANWDRQIHVDYPASDPYVIACGGTQIDQTSGQDVVWNDNEPFDPDLPDSGGWTTGGGISKCFTDIPNYQKNANLPVSIDGNTQGRGVPDLAMSATNYFVQVDQAVYASGGTSAVAPLMAALVALCNQAKNKRSGYLNPVLYANPQVFHDVVSGNNTIPPSASGTDGAQGYSAGQGWDACTGLGTPNGTAILNLL